MRMYRTYFLRPTSSSEECGFLCYQDSSATCGYYVHLSGECHLGTLDNDPVAVPPGTPDATVYVFNSEIKTFPNK